MCVFSETKTVLSIWVIEYDPQQAKSTQGAMGTFVYPREENANLLRML